MPVSNMKMRHVLNLEVVPDWRSAVRHRELMVLGNQELDQWRTSSMREKTETRGILQAVRPNLLPLFFVSRIAAQDSVWGRNRTLATHPEVEKSRSLDSASVVVVEEVLVQEVVDIVALARECLLTAIVVLLQAWV